MMRPVILSRPEKLAFLLVILVAGGSVTTSSPGCSVGRRLRHALGLALARRQSRQRIAPGGALATPGCPGCGGCDRDARLGALGNDGGAGRRRQRLRLERFRAAARPAPAADGSGVGNSRPRGSSGTSSSSSGMAAAAADCREEWRPAGAAADRKDIADLRAAPAAQATIVVAAIRAAKPVRAMVRNISRL